MKTVRFLLPLVPLLVALGSASRAPAMQENTPQPKNTTQQELTGKTNGNATTPTDSAPADPALADPVQGEAQPSRSPSDGQPAGGQVAASRGDSDGPSPAPGSTSRAAPLIASLTVFVLAIFVGFEVITKVPPTLHTPLMSGSNAISGITIVGALLVAGAGLGGASMMGLIAVVLASINVVGGFLVTHRMLAMFKSR